MTGSSEIVVTSVYVWIGCIVSVRKEVSMIMFDPRLVDVTGCTSVKSGIEGIDGVNEAFCMSPKPAGLNVEHDLGPGESC